MKTLIGVLLIFIAYPKLFAQVEPIADFSFPAQALCLSEEILFENNSLNSTSYEWDFCDKDFDGFSSVSLLGSLTGLGRALGIDLVKDDDIWYGFATSWSTNKIYRLKFSNGLSQAPTEVVDLGNPNGVLVKPVSIHVVKRLSTWYLLVHNWTTSSIIKITIGTDIQSANISTATMVTNVGGSPAKMDVIDTPGELKAGVVLGNGSIRIIDFKNDLELPVLPADIITTPVISGVTSARDVSFIKDGNNWFAFVGVYTPTSIYRLDFGSNVMDGLLTSPVQVMSSNFGGSVNNVEITNSGLGYYIHILTFEGGLFKINLPAITSIPLVENLIRYGQSINYNEGYVLKFVKDQGSWYGFTFQDNLGSNPRLYGIKSVFNCGQSIKYSTGINPIISYNVSGTYPVTLNAVSAIGEVSSVTKNLTVGIEEAPMIGINSLGNCSSSAVEFNGVSDQLLSSSVWSFGDSNTSSVSNPTHQYSTPGEYNVQLNVAAENGCHNFTEKTIKIYDPPTSLFDLPSGLVCTNNEFTFTNSTVDNFDGNLTYEWLVNDVQKSTSRDFKYLFTSEGDQQVKLRTSIPGCSDELAQTLFNVLLGPVVDFSFTGKCEEETILFTNASSGSISGYQWDFGSGEVSTDQDPSEIYTSYGNYNVSLGTTAINGCVSTITKPVSIYSKPQTNFSIDLPPFACSGTPSQFNDLTPPMPDSNITSWAWSFGDPTNGISSQKNPLYTYSVAADYQVSLTTTSNFGCSNFIQKSTTIYPSPQADFSWMAACLNQPTYFLDASTGDIKSWLWSIQGNTYSVKNPVHTFKSVSSYPVLLTVTGTNNCISQAFKNVNVPVPVVPDFSSSSTCATKPSVFDEITKGGADPAVSWSWTFASQGSGTGSPTQHVFPTSGNYSVSMNTTRQSGCIYSVTKTIPIVESPNSKFTVFLESGGAPFTVTPSNESTNATKYLWKPGDPNQSNSSLFSPSFTYNNLGDYILELEASNELGCKDYLQQLISVVIPQINAAIADFRLEKIPGSDNYSSVVTIENKSNVALVNPVVDLDLSGKTTISETIEAIIKPNELFPYIFKAIIAPQSLEFACTEVYVNADDYAFDNRQCVNLLDDFVSRIPYPNPASNELMLEWINNDDVPMDLVIYNVSGQAIISRKYTPTLKGLNQVKLDVSGLAAGIYFVSYKVENHTQNFRFSIVR